jgi:hypothetical protein
VTGPYATAVIVVALVLAVWAFVLVALNRPPSLPLFFAAVLLELLLLVFAIGGIVQMIGTSHTFARWEFVGYLLALLLVPVAAVGWGWGEKTRSGTAVIAVGFLVVPVLVLRVQQVWAGPPHV